MAVNRRLSAEAAEAKEFEEENLQLRRLLKLDPPAAWRYVAAEVILRDPVLWNEHFTIDRGSRDGLTKGSRGHQRHAGREADSGRHPGKCRSPDQ